MLTPKEKAKQILELFRNATDGIAAYDYDSVNFQCAFILVREMFECSQGANYYLEVKKELELIKSNQFNIKRIKYISES
jgi:hypothetical protein